MVNPKSAHSRAKSVRLRVKSTSHLTKCYLIPQSLYQGVVVLKVTLNWTDVSQQVQCIFSRQHGLLHTRVSHRGSQCAHLCILPFPAPSLHRLQDCAPLFLWKLALWVEVKVIGFFSILSFSGTVSAISVIQCIAVLTNGVSTWLNRSEYYADKGNGMSTFTSSSWFILKKIISIYI